MKIHQNARGGSRSPVVHAGRMGGTKYSVGQTGATCPSGNRWVCRPLGMHTDSLCKIGVNSLKPLQTGKVAKPMRERG